MKNLYVISLLFFCFCSCKNEEKNEMLQKKYYDNGTVKEEIFRKGDTIFAKDYSPSGKMKDYIRTYNINPDDSFLNGHNIRYFDNGNVEFDFFWRKGKANGIMKNYFDNGKLESTGNFVNGLKEDTWYYYYYGDGNIKKMMNFNDDIPVGMHFNYNIYNKIEKISFRNNDGKIIYYRNYDDFGNIISEQGFPLSESYNNNSLKLQDTLELTFRIGWIPDWEVSVVVNEIKPINGKVIMQLTDSNKFITNGWGKYIETYHVFKNAGVYQWGAEIKIFDKKLNREMAYKDTFQFVVNP